MPAEEGGHRARLQRIQADAAESVRELDARIDAITRARTADNSDDEHDPEGATIAFERSQAVALRRAAVQRMREAQGALDRVADGVEALCAVCGEPIPPARLDARPTATTCVRHA